MATHRNRPPGERTYQLGRRPSRAVPPWDYLQTRGGSAVLTAEQQAEIDRRIEAHARRVAAAEKRMEDAMRTLREKDRLEQAQVQQERDRAREEYLTKLLARRQDELTRLAGRTALVTAQRQRALDELARLQWQRSQEEAGEMTRERIEAMEGIAR